jgi:uncharacterized protein (DUF1800 family)
MGEPLYGFQTPNGYSDSAESWVNTGGLLERMNFGLALASNRVQGTRVDLQKLTAPHDAADKNQLMDQALKTILAGDISPETRNALLLQVDQPAVVSVPTASNRAEQPDQMTAQLNGPRAQRPRVDANVNDPVTKTIGLILGTPEFQRQ